MTAFFMPCCKSKRDWRPLSQWLASVLRAVARLVGLPTLALLLGMATSAAWAGGVAVDKAELRAGEEGYRPVADFAVVPTFGVEQALTHGVPLYFVSEFALVRPRWYWLDETVAHDEQAVKLSYNALTRQYRIAYGALFQNFSNLSDALSVLRHQIFAPVHASSLKSGVKYVASVRLYLDLTQLPKPLQINALVNTDWEFDSGSYQWDVNTDSFGRVVVKERAP